jgi:hypothetical protein
MAKIEFASAGKGGLSAFAGLAKRTGRPLSEIVELAAENRLLELFDRNGFVGKPLTGEEARRRLDKLKDGRPPLSPAIALAQLEARRAGWSKRERA